MNLDQLPRQSVPVRPVHLETPGSYFTRLCTANSIDRPWMETVVRQRRRTGGRGADELGVVIAELGGPEPGRFESAHACALIGHRNLRGPWDKQSATSIACLSCTAGAAAATYPHIRFAFCRRHGQWLGKLQRPGVLDADLWKAEHTLRSMVRSGYVTRELYEGTWDAVRDHAYMIGENAQPERLRRALDQREFTIGTDDRIALFPQTVLALRAVTRPQLITLAGQGSRKRHEVRSALTDSLDWAGDDRWLLVKNLQELLQVHVRSVA
jgi:hypothetical protein